MAVIFFKGLVMKHQSAYDRVLKHMNQGKEPKGHCEAMNKRCENILQVAKRNIEKDLRSK